MEDADKKVDSFDGASSRHGSTAQPEPLTIWQTVSILRVLGMRECLNEPPHSTPPLR